MEDQVKRLFIGGLPSSTNDSEIKTRFGRYGDISDINLARKDSVNGKLEHCFAHINFHGNEQQLKKLISTFNNTRWKGKTLKIETAKENFLDRLAKEKSAGLQDTPNIVSQTRGDQFLENLKKAGVNNFTMKKAVPGTGITGEKNWVVGKYGRVMPVVYLRTKDKKKVAKFDPSKYIHHLKQFKDQSREDEIDDRGGIYQSWREQNTPSHARNKRSPREREIDGVLRPVRRKAELGYREQWSDKAEGQNCPAFDDATVEKDINQGGGIISQKRASMKKKYFHDGSSSEDYGAIDGSLKRKARYDGDPANADESSGSKVKKTKELQGTATKSDASSSCFKEAVKGRRAVVDPGDGIRTKSKNVGGNLATFVKTKKDGSEGANSHLFNFFDEHDSSSSEIEQEGRTYGHKSDHLVEISTEESSGHSDFNLKSKTEETTMKEKDVEVKVERKYNSTEREDVKKRQQRKVTNVAGKLEGEENRVTEGRDSSSVSSEDDDIILATSPEVATAEEEQETDHRVLRRNESDKTIKEVLDPDDLISSIIDEMKTKEISQSNETDLGIVGNEKESGGVEKHSDEADSDIKSKSILLQTVNSSIQPVLSGIKCSKDILISTNENDKLLTSGDSEEFKGISLLKETSTTEGFKGKHGLAPKEENAHKDSNNGSENHAGQSFKSNLILLSNQKQSSSESSDSDSGKMDEKESEDDDMREDGVNVDTGKDSERAFDGNEEEVDDSVRLAKDLNDSKKGKDSKDKSLETSKDNKQNSGRNEKNKRKASDVGKLGENSSFQEEKDKSSEWFELLVLDREVLRKQGLIPEDESGTIEGGEDEEQFSGIYDNDSQSSSDDQKGRKSKKKKRKRKFVFQEFKGMNNFRKNLEEKRCEVETNEPLGLKDVEDEKMEGENIKEANSSDDEELPSEGRDILTLRISGSVKDLGSKSENGLIVLEKNGGIEGKGEGCRKSKKGGKVTNVGYGESKSVEETKSVAVGAEDEGRGLDADDESSSTESSINEKKRKKKKKKNKKREHIENVKGETELVECQNEQKVFEESFSSISKERIGVVEGRAKKREKKDLQKMDEYGVKIGGDFHDRRKGFVEETEDGMESLSVDERDEMKHRRAKTSYLKNENQKKWSSGGDTTLSEKQMSEDAAMKRSPGMKTSLEDMAETSNQKRLKAVKERQAELKQKQTAIQDALAAVDSKEKSNDKKHMRFECSSEDNSDTEEREQDRTEEQEPKGKSMTLFDDSDDEEDNSTSDDERFQLKPQFEGEIGTKLLKLQDKFGDDQRFKLDKRFAEDIDEDDNDRNVENSKKIGGEKEGESADLEAIDLEAEKANSLTILENVLGKLLPRNKDVDDKKSQFRDVNYLHFDPTREDHSKFVLPQLEEDEDGKPRKNKKRKKKKNQEDEDDLDNPLPEVSKELFSEVKTDLKSAFSQEGPSSFSFFKDDDVVIGGEQKQNNQDEEEAIPITDHLFEKKKLRWDSSESEEETEETAEHESVKKPKTIKEPVPIITPRSFFFDRNDNRLQGVANQFCRGKDADVSEVWNDAKQQILRAGTKRHQKALRDSQRNKTRRSRLSNFKGKSSGGKS